MNALFDFKNWHNSDNILLYQLVQITREGVNAN